MHELNAEGTYTGHFEEVQVGKASTGTTQVAVTYMVEELDISRTIFLYMTAAAEKYSIKKLQNAGFNFDFENPDCDVETVELECRHDTDQNGDPRERWDYKYRGGSVDVDPLDTTAIKTLNAKYKHLRSAGKPAARTAPASPPPVRKTAVTRESVWAVFLDSDKCPEPDNIADASFRWGEILDELYPDTDEEKFTAEHWTAVKLHIETPF